MNQERQLTQKGAALASVALTLIYMAYIGSTLRTGFGQLLDVLIGLVAGGLSIILLSLFAWLVLQVFRIFGRRPGPYPAVVIGSTLTFMVFLVAFAVPLNVAVPIGGGLMLAFIAMGVGIGRALDDTGNRVVTAGLVASGLVLAGLVIALLVSSGTDRNLVRVNLPPAETLAANSPAEPGPYEVRTLFYGSGKDLHRPEFGDDVSLTTPSTDVTAYVQLDGFGARARENYWGFGLDELPLNGRVWYPVAEGPFPLVLIVHGNDFMTEPADTGYAYLGELLASRGYIVVSVDENFFNAYTTGPMRQEIDGRAILLLEHLRQWQGWNETEGNIFYQKVDFDNIALVGHSRGGEAAAVAAHFAQLETYPDDPAVPLDYEFEIDSVVGIAPSYGQYQPAGEDLQLEDTNYLLLQGSHDADNTAFWGIRMYNGVTFSGDEPGMKAAVYAYRANHSQFNTAWGRRDGTIPVHWLLNQKPLLAAEEQRQVARVFITAFLEATLHDDATYLPIFHEPRRAAGWLPDTLYITRFQDSSHQALATFEEDEDPGTASRADTSLLAQNLDWAEEEVKFRFDTSQHSHAARLAWDAIGGQYTVSLPPGYASENGFSASTLLTFDVADLQPYAIDGELLDLSIELATGTGASERIPLADYTAPLPPLHVQLTKWAPWELDEFPQPTEPIFQTVAIPLGAFESIDPAEITAVRFLFDRSPSGTILLDDIGFAGGLYPDNRRANR